MAMLNDNSLCVAYRLVDIGALILATQTDTITKRQFTKLADIKGGIKEK